MESEQNQNDERYLSVQPTSSSPNGVAQIPHRSRGVSIGSAATGTSGISTTSSYVSTISTKASDSNLDQRQREFEKNFTKRIEEQPISCFGAEASTLDTFTLPDDYLTILATQAADLQASILIHGRLALTRYHLCFRSNIIGIITVKIHPLTDIISIKKGTTAKWIQNAIYVRVAEVDEEGKQVEQHYGYGSLRDRNSLYDGLMECWQVRAPERYAEFMKQEALENGEEIDDDDEEDVTAAGVDDGTGPVIKRTHGSGEQYQELAINAKLPLQLDQTFNLLYHNDAFTNNFYTNEKKLTELKISDWEEELGTGNKKRTLNYVMHMNNAIGPKSSSCNGSETIVIADPENSYEIVSETQTPDIPSGKSFVIRTRTCLTHDSLHHKQATRIHCTTQVDWSASSMLKGTITPAVIKGQKEHHRQLLAAMTSWVREHPEEFEGVDHAQVEVKHEEDPVLGGDTVNETVGKTIMGHASEIPDNPVMVVISILFVLFAVLYIRGLM